MDNSNNVITFKELAYKAIAKSQSRIFKREAGVLQDKNPEDLHQMRVGIRRLRSAIASFVLAVDLPKIVTDKNFNKISRPLGKLRDLDVLLDILANNYRPQLSTKEQIILERILKSLKKERQHKLKQVRKTLNSKLYLKLKQELNSWLEQPKYQISNNLSVDYFLPDLLLPQVCQFLIHPGWFVGVETKSAQIDLPRILNKNAIEHLLTPEETFLHNLRKSAKKTRYSLELFSQFYGDTYRHYLKQIKAVQEILGHIQDTQVMRKILEQNLCSSTKNKMPQLTNLLLQIRYQKWLEWQELQKQFLNEQTRREFRQTIIK